MSSWRQGWRGRWGFASAALMLVAGCAGMPERLPAQATFTLCWQEM